MKKNVFIFLLTMIGLAAQAQTKINIAQGLSNGTITATHSSLQTGESITEAFDNNSATAASFECANPTTVTLSFQQSQNLSRSCIMMGYNSSGSYTLETADNISDLTSRTGTYRLVFSDSPAGEGLTCRDFASVPARVARISATRTAGQGCSVNLSEWELYNAASACPGVTANFQNSTNLCVGSTISFWYSGTGSPAQFQYIVDGTSVASTGSNLNYQFLSGGNHTVTLNASTNGTCWSTVTKTIYVTPNVGPISTNVQGYICGSHRGIVEFTFSVPPIPNTTFNWWVDGGPATVTLGQGTNVVKIKFGSSFTGGTVRVAGSSANGCYSEAAFTVVVNNACRTAVISPEDFGAYPNPFTDATPVLLSGVEGEVQVTVCDAQGKILYTNEHHEASLPIGPLSSAAEGIYFVKVVANGEVRIIKVVKGK